MTRDKIIDATLKIISTDGMKRLTVRRIAEETGANIAAINYHFGSKEALVNEALKLFAEKTKHVFSVLEQQGMTPRERIRTLVYRFADHVTEYPGFLKTFIAAIILGESPSEPALANMTQNVKLVFAFLKDHFGTDNDTVRNTMVQLMSALIYPAIIGNKMEELYKIPYSDSAYRKKYLDQLLETFDI